MPRTYLARLKSTLLMAVVPLALGIPCITPVLAHESDDVTFTSVDIAGATATAVTGINAYGVLGGIYRDASHGHHSWIRSGTTTTIFDYPGTSGITFISGINDSGTVAGATIDGNGTGRGFTRAADGTFSAINDPLAGQEAGQGTFLVNITDRGVVSGSYVDAQNVSHGLLYFRGRFTTIDAPRAGTAAGQGTVPGGVNDAGVITGNIIAADNVNYGFVGRPGEFRTIVAPGAGTAPGQGTIPVSIAQNGAIAGQAIDSSNNIHGWILRDHEFMPIEDPLGVGNTSPLNGSEDGNVVVGAFVDANGRGHGFVARIDMT